jgi:hypothetical protein
LVDVRLPVQFVQAMVPPVLYCPPVQAVQTALPVMAFTPPYPKPARQVAQVALPVPMLVVPVGQLVQDDGFPDDEVNWPCGQAVQSTPPAGGS